MERCMLPVEIFARIAGIDGGVAIALRTSTRLLHETLHAPVVIQLPEDAGKPRYIVYTNYNQYKLQQLYVGAELIKLRYSDGKYDITIDTKRCYDRSYMVLAEGGAGGKTNGHSSAVAANPHQRGALRITPQIAPRSRRMMSIPQGPCTRSFISPGQTTTHFYCVETVNTSTITTRMLERINNTVKGHKTFKVWVKDHYRVFEYDANWRLLQSPHAEMQIPKI